MAEAVQVEVAEAVRDILAANKFGHSFDPERSYADWDMDLTEETGTLVDVVGIVVSSEWITRNQLRYRVAVDIAVRRKFGLAEGSNGRLDVAEIDKLCALVQDVHEYFCNPDNARLTAYEPATWDSTEIRTVPDKEALRRRQFTGVIRVTYDVKKAF